MQVWADRFGREQQCGGRWWKVVLLGKLFLVYKYTWLLQSRPLMTVVYSNIPCSQPLFSWCYAKVAEFFSGRWNSFCSAALFSSTEHLKTKIDRAYLVSWARALDQGGFWFMHIGNVFVLFLDQKMSCMRHQARGGCVLGSERPRWKEAWFWSPLLSKIRCYSSILQQVRELQWRKKKTTAGNQMSNQLSSWEVGHVN